MRADRCSVYGYPRPTTPNLERLAERGALFELAYAPMPTTGPSHATLFTGLHPIAHGVVRNGLALPDAEVMLAELLRANGYRTAAFVSSFPVTRPFGFGQGFEHFDETFARQTSTVHLSEWEGLGFSGGFDRIAEATTDAALAWLEVEADRDAPLFVWVHYFDPHAPYEPPAEHLQKVGLPSPGTPPQSSNYDGEVAYVDHEIGRFVDAVLASRAAPLIVITADHGEGLMARGWMGHNRSTYEEEVRVPLLVLWPTRIEPGKRMRTPAHLVDVVPTVVAALSLDARDARFEGVDLYPELRGQAEPDPLRPVYFARPFYPEGRGNLPDRGEGFGLRLGRYKLFVAGEEGKRQLYDLLEDPQELRNLWSRRPDVVAPLSRRLAEWVDDQRRRHPPRPLVSPPDVEPGLRALGYLDDEEETH